MQTEITPQTLPLLIPYKAAEITVSLLRDLKLDLKQALLVFYRSRAYALLEKESTKLWQASPEQIYMEYFTPAPKKPHYQNGPMHSKLTPFAGQLQAWRKQGMSFRAIAEELRKRGCDTTPQNICRYLARGKRDSDLQPRRPDVW